MKQTFYAQIQKAYLVTIAFIIMPPFSLNGSFLSTHTFSKLVWIVLLAVLLIFYKSYKNISQYRLFLVLTILYFFSQSLSVLAAQNIPAFISRYEDLVFGFIFLFVSLLLLPTIESSSIHKSIFIAVIVNASMQITMLLVPFSVELFSYIFSPSFTEIVQINIARSRIYFDTYDEIFIPLSLYYLFKLQQKKQSVLLIVLSVLAFASNFRTRLVMLLFALSSSLIILKAKIRTIFFFSVIVILLLLVLDRIFLIQRGFTVIDRLMIQSTYEDRNTITSRFDHWREAIEIGKSSPLIGVGLGNYYDYLSLGSKQSFSANTNADREFKIAVTHPHNTVVNSFAETGLIGLMMLIILLCYFAYHDFLFLFSNDTLRKMYVIGFWTLFISALFNPDITAKYQVLFWLFRAMILIKPLHDS